MAPLSSTAPELSEPPQMNTDSPMATEAARQRAAMPSAAGGDDMDTQPPVHALDMQERGALQLSPQTPQLSNARVVSTQVEPQQL